MDLSKLPKLSESPAPPPGEPAPVLPAQPLRIPLAETGIDALISLVVGGIFLMQGAPFGGWLLARIAGEPYVYNSELKWTAGPLQGQVVEYFDVLFGVAWRDMGTWVAGVCLLVGAGVILLVSLLPKLARPLLVLSVLLAVGAAIANVVAVIMQVKSGFTQPIWSMIVILISGIIAFFHGRHLSTQGR